MKGNTSSARNRTPADRPAHGREERNGPRGDDAVPPPGRAGPAPWAIGTAAVAAVAAIALIAFSLSRPEPPGHAPTPTAVPFQGAADGSLVFTADASDARRWRYCSFERGALVDGGRATHWDVAFRRFRIIANGGPAFAGIAGIADLGGLPFEAALPLPPDAFVQTRATGDSVNTAIERWYRYGFTSHLLTPLERTYVVRTATGSQYALRVLGYYCPGARPGCLTIRYRALNGERPGEGAASNAPDRP